MKLSLLLLMCWSCVVFLARCDNQQPPIEQTAATPAVDATRPPGIEPVPRFTFDNDDAFAAFARELEPEHFYVSSGIRGTQLLHHGRWALGYFFNNPNYNFWTAAQRGDDFASHFLDDTPAAPDDKTRGYFSRDWLVCVAPDGTWGHFAWRHSDASIRTELWRLTGKTSGDDAIKHERFHSFPAVPANHLRSPSISSDSEHLLHTVGGRWHVSRVDAAAGSVKSRAITLPAAMQDERVSVVTLQFIGKLTCLVSISKRSAVPDVFLHSVGVASLSLPKDENNPALLTVHHWLQEDHADDQVWVAHSADGRFLLTHHAGDELAPVTFWQLADSVQTPPRVVTTLPPAIGSGGVSATFTADGSKLALVARSQVHLFDTKNLTNNNLVPIATYPALGLCTDLAFSQDQSKIFLLFRNGTTTLIRLNQPREIDAQIGEAVIRWDVPTSPPSSDRWPAIKFESRIKHGEAPLPSTLILDVRNDGTGPAHQLRASLTVDPPLQAAKPVANLGTLHFGTLNQSINAIRFLDLPLDPQLLAKARRFSLTLTTRDGFNPPPKHWLHLPRTLKDEQAYHAMAKDIFDRAAEALVKAKGSPFKEPPKLRAMSASEFGFRVSFGDIVMYQNPFIMDQNALRVNRAVMQVDSLDELMRHAQMMLFWYLPHELVHCADHRTSWGTEYVANMIQPYLTARILEAMPDAPMSVQSMAYVYDRYVEELRPALTADEIARVERFIQSEGQGPPPWNMSAPDLFRTNTPAYVYFGARINQHAWSKQTSLEDLCRQLLTPPAAPTPPAPTPTPAQDSPEQE